MNRTAPFGTWRSPITSAVATASGRGFGSLASDGAALYWLESRPDERGRTTLMRDDGTTRIELTPAPMNVRSRVHEYGGGSFHAAGGRVFFVDFETQNVHEIGADGSARAVTSGDASERYADFAYDVARNRLICVFEQHDASGEVQNSLIAIDLANGARTALHAGHDFYAAPRIAPDQSRLCFLAWDHPNMPWDGTQLKLAPLESDGRLGATTVIAGGADESIAEPRFIGDAHRLLFASDRNGWWNLYSYDNSGVYAVHEAAAEFAQPQWQFGQQTYDALSARHIICQRQSAGTATLVLVDVDAGFATPVDADWSAYDSLVAHQGALCAIAHRPDHASAVIRLDLASRSEQIIVSAGPLPIDQAYLSVPESIMFPTRDGERAHAYYYSPCNPDFGAPAGERPPLLVMSHGGPTSATRPLLNFRVQYYTSRGWAVVDVNYRGSTGFGRTYRDRLKGNWGVIDVQDCEDAVEYLRRSGRIDPGRVAIRGGSAGGFTTLAALCQSDRFKAGASHYGVGDLEALARDTHKFESRYLDTLIGPYPEAKALYQARSPIHHVDRLRCPVIVLQGLKDRVVPPSQAEAIVAALNAKKVPVAYVPFAEEQHGFRDAANIRRALDSEHTFFARVFGIDSADQIDLEIMHL
jgi:dipeptidyl aminopeptidase/acylaminoacyl peptidase